jgi:hypothetical protein
VVIAGSDACPVTRVELDGTDNCIWSGGPFAARAATVAGGNDLLVLGSFAGDPSTTVLLEYDGANKWRTIASWAAAEAAQIGPLAASTSAILISGSNQFARSAELANGIFAPIPDVPAGDYGSAWIYSSSDLFLGDGAGRLSHYDGVAWKTVDSMLGDSIYGMWGAPDRTVFAFSQFGFGRLKGDLFEVIQHPPSVPPSDYFVRAWGNSAKEVFLAVNDNNFKPYDCGTTFLVWFDGSVFHQF